MSFKPAYKIPSMTWDKIYRFAEYQQTSVSIQQMILFGSTPNQGTLYKASQFLQEELPIRLAHRVKELDELPENLAQMPSIIKVKEWYAQSFEELVSIPPPNLPSETLALLKGKPGTFVPPSSPSSSASLLSARLTFPPSLFSNQNNSPWPTSSDNPSLDFHHNGSGFQKLKSRIPLEKRYYAPVAGVEWPPVLHDYNEHFTKVLQKIKHRHDPTVLTVAQGVLEWKKNKKSERIGLSIQQFLDRFYLSRIGIRFLIGQHIALNTLPPHSGYVGIICEHTNVHDICEEAIENATFVCEQHFGLINVPKIELVCDKNLTFPYVPGHLSHIIFELLKNSLRATVDFHGGADEESFPPIKIIVVEGSEDITLKISDEGGGIPRSAMEFIWTYMYTTMEASALEAENGPSDFTAPMAGFGYGLPLSRLYAKFFGGDLKLISMEGYGTDVYIHLNKLGESREPLPYGASGAKEEGV
ncbi:mitochondrial branched-chain alpha-ketoacid dehydrogenase kinase-domain-containing protein [Mrakia frigida]|uniref:PDK/BCKDK family protein kinase n=1 Tax=Mrakia frigida TaxID=29902 RepID=UPI003FCBFF19